MVGKVVSRMIHVIGAGGTGGWLIPVLVKTVDPEAVLLWDADAVEPKNITRQNFTIDEVGELKVDRMSHRYGIPIVNATYFGDENESAIQEGDIVIICADNFHVRAVIDEISTKRRFITVINAGNEEISTSTQVFVKRDGVHYTPRITYMHDEIKRGMTAQDLACAEVANLPGGEQTVAANMLSASLALMALVQVLTWDRSPLRPDARPMLWHEFLTDMKHAAASEVDWREDGVGDWK